MRTAPSLPGRSITRAFACRILIQWSPGIAGGVIVVRHSFSPYRGLKKPVDFFGHYSSEAP